MSDDKMSIWNAVSKTDPDHTKKVNQRGGFTAISASYQIMNATRTFGPVGIGWGYDVVGREIINGVIIVDVAMWHGSRENVFGPMPGCCKMFSGDRIDEDAPKKATTDAITKLLSHLGFNADVFLGMYDDNRYVQSLIEEKKNKAKSSEPKNEPTEQEIETAIGHINAQSTLDGLKVYWSGLAKSHPSIAMNEEVKLAKDHLKATLEERAGGTG